MRQITTSFLILQIAVDKSRIATGGSVLLFGICLVCDDLQKRTSIPGYKLIDRDGTIVNDNLEGPGQLAAKLAPIVICFHSLIY